MNFIHRRCLLPDEQVQVRKLIDKLRFDIKLADIQIEGLKDYKESRKEIIRWLKNNRLKDQSSVASLLQSNQNRRVI